MQISEYYDLLSKHDWTFEMSDDHRVWKAGHAEQQTLKSIAKQSPEHAQLYDAWHAHVWTGLPKPERPS